MRGNIRGIDQHQQDNHAITVIYTISYQTYYFYLIVSVITNDVSEINLDRYLKIIRNALNEYCSNNRNKFDLRTSTYFQYLHIFKCRPHLSSYYSEPKHEYYWQLT